MTSGALLIVVALPERRNAGMLEVPDPTTHRVWPPRHRADLGEAPATAPPGTVIDVYA
jgi:hypothetical protein